MSRARRSEETHARGKLVLAHPTSLDGIRVALAAGVDVIVHTTLGEEAPWDAALLAEWSRRTCRSFRPSSSGRTSCARKRRRRQSSTLIGATLEELRDSTRRAGRSFRHRRGLHARVRSHGRIRLHVQGGHHTHGDPGVAHHGTRRALERSRTADGSAGIDADLVVLAGDPQTDVKNFAQGSLRVPRRQAHLCIRPTAISLGRFAARAARLRSPRSRSTTSTMPADYAISLLARRDYSSQELKKKLAQRGYIEHAYRSRWSTTWSP